MNFASQNWILATILSIILIAALILINRYYTKYSHSHINDIKDLAKHSDKYRLYFLVTGIFFPTSEAMMDVFKVREESELLHYLIVGAFCVSMAIMSQYVKKVRNNLHKIFVGFFCTLSILLFYNIYTAAANSVNLIEFTMFVILSYYVFFNIKHFYTYILVAIIFIAILLSIDIIDAKLFILYFNSCFVAIVFLYGIYIIDVNIKENLFFAYNFVNKGALLVVGVNEKGKIIFISENIKAILGYNKEDCIGKNWQNIIHGAFEIEDVEGLGKKVFLQKIILDNEKYKLIEWREESSHKDLKIKVGKDITESQKAEIELKRTSELLEQTSRIARVGGWEFDFGKQELYYSEITKELFGVMEASSSNRLKILNYFVEGENRNTLIKAFVNCVKLGIPYDCELQIINDKGRKLWIRTKGNAEFINNRTKRVYGTIQDIDEQVKLTQLIKDNEYQYRTLISNISSAAFRCINSEPWTMIFISDAIERISGYAASDFIDNFKRSYSSIIHPADKAFVDTVFKDSVDKGEEYTIEYRLLDINNNIVWVNEKGKGFIEDNGQSSFLDGVITDITERKNIEAKLAENQAQLIYKSEMLAAIAQITEKLLISTDIEKTLNESFIAIGEAAKADRAYYFENDIKTNIISQKVEWVREYISPQINNQATQKLSFENIYFYTEPLLQNKIFQKTISEVDDKVRERWAKQNILSVLLLPIFIKNNFYGFIGFDDCTNEQLWSDDKLNLLQSLATNIANAIERINNEKIIKESESNFRQINETIDDVFYLLDVVNNKYLYISPSCKNVLGEPQEFFFSEHSYFQKHIFEEDKHIPAVIENQFITNNSVDVEYRINVADNQIRWISEKAFAIKNNEGKIVRMSGICSDITDKKLAQNEIKQLSLVAEKITNGVLITDATGHVIWANQALLAMMEITSYKLYGKRPRDLFNPETTEFSSKSTIMDAHNYTIEVEVLTHMKNKKWVQINNTAIKNEEGEILQQIEIIIDITERKKAEIELLIAHQQTNAANKAKAELELRALQMQMNPHFVFNALNSIQSYVMSQDTASANNYLTKFAQLIRLFLDSSRSKFIPLEEEIRLLTLYIELEKIRFDEKFDFEIVLDKKVSKYFEIPTMILQPFVENAINHGLRYKKEKGLLSIKFTMKSNYLKCKIEDNGVGRKKAEEIKAKSNKGYQSQGLKITAERLMTYNKINEANIEFSVNDLVQNSTNQNDEVGTLIEIKFPEN